MALKSTIFKADLNVSDLNHHYYQDHALTIARHPSENDERMMMRILAFAFAIGEANGEGLSFGKGLSTDDEPDLWQKSLTGDVMHWLEVGRPSEERIRKACGKAKKVSVFCYGGHAAELWWKELEKNIKRHSNLHIYNIAKTSTDALAMLAERNMQLQSTIDENNIILSDNSQVIDIQLEPLFPSNG